MKILFCSIFFFCVYANIYLVLEIFNGNYNSSYLYFLYKGRYNIEAVFLMESRICKELVCASVLPKSYEIHFEKKLIWLKKQTNNNKKNCTNAQPEADN